jgi:hypothetical protein
MSTGHPINSYSHKTLVMVSSNMLKVKMKNGTKIMILMTIHKFLIILMK